jgi:hypothetical protein
MQMENVEVTGYASRQAQHNSPGRLWNRFHAAKTAFSRVFWPGSLVVAIASVLLAGCASSGYEKSDVAAQSLRTAASQVQAENTALDLTMASLHDLVNTPGAGTPPADKRFNKPSVDLKPGFERFSKALERLQAAAARNDQAAVQIAQKHAAYLANWNKELGEMKYEAVKTRSEARKNEVSQRFESVNRRYAEARAATQPLIEYLVDVRKALSNDLTTGGLESVKPIVQNAEENTTKVRAALARLSDELNSSSTQLASIITLTPDKSEASSK